MPHARLCLFLASHPTGTAWLSPAKALLLEKNGVRTDSRVYTAQHIAHSVAHVSAAGDLHVHRPAPSRPRSRTSTAATVEPPLVENDHVRCPVYYSATTQHHHPQFDDVLGFEEPDAAVTAAVRPWHTRCGLWKRAVPAAVTATLFLTSFVCLPQPGLRLLGFALWKWLLWLAWLTPLAWASAVGIHLLLLVVESTYLATRMVVYFLIGTKARRCSGCITASMCGAISWVVSHSCAVVRSCACIHSVRCVSLSCWCSMACAERGQLECVYPTETHYPRWRSLAS